MGLSAYVLVGGIVAVMMHLTDAVSFERDEISGSKQFRIRIRIPTIRRLFDAFGFKSPIRGAEWSFVEFSITFWATERLGWTGRVCKFNVANHYRLMAAVGFVPPSTIIRRVFQRRTKNATKLQFRHVLIELSFLAPG